MHTFPCGTRALDFAGTLRARRNDEPMEMLATGSDLDAWFTESGLLTSPAQPSAVDLVAALEIREAIYAAAWSRLHDDDLPANAVARINEAASRSPVTPSLTSSGSVRTGDTRQALSTLAREAIEVLAGDLPGLLRECGRPECTQIYLDTSRGHRREWCSMAICGSRMKAKAYRDRQRA